MSINLLHRCRHAVSLTVAVACLGLLAASPASATTFVVKSTLELEKAVASANQNTEANTIELAAGTYQPTKTLIITNTGGTQTIAGPVGSIGVFTPGAKISGSNVVPVGASEHELITVPIGVSLTVKHVVVTGGGSASNSAIEDYGSLNVENATIDGNTGTQINVHGGATASLTNSTLADGLELGMADEGEASFVNVTVVHNGTDGIGGTGSGKLRLTNTIVALNEGSAQCGSFSTLTNDHSLASDASCGGEVAFQSKTPLLQTSLLNDGGSTTLYSEKAGSPTIDAGDPAKCPATDQRGYPRPDVGGTACDIGADEYSPTAPTIKVPAEIVAPATSGSGAVVSYSVEATDSDALVKSLTCLPASGATFPVGTTKVECAAVNGHENKATASFNVTVSAATTVPVVTSVTPNEGPEAGGTQVTIKGEHLEGATEAKFGTTLATELKVVSGSEITVKDPAHTPGTIDVTVKTPAGTSTTSSTDHFTYQAPPPPPASPVVTSVTPNEGPEAGGTQVTIKGEHLEGATEAKFGTTLATELKVVSGSEITVKDPAHTPGTIDVTVKTPAGTSTTSSTDHFTYQAPPPPPASPVVTSVTPNEGPEAGGTQVTIKGEHLEGATEAKFGTTLATELKVVSGSEITVKDPAHTPGTIDVTVKTPAGTSTTSSTDHFTYQAPPPPPASPVVTSVTPNEGPEAGGTQVTIKGEHLEGATEAKFGTTLATELKVVSGSEITVKDPAHTPGTIDVTVKTPAGTSTTSSTDHFTYQAPPPPPASPVVTSVTPNEGPEAGGTQVTIKGEHLEGATEAKFGTTLATELKVVSGSEITVKDPAHTPGTIDVTVKTPAGTSTTSSTDHFTYQAPPPPPASPVVTSVTPNEGPEAGGTQVTIKGEHLEGATEAKFGTTLATELKVVSGSEITVKDPAHTPGTIDVTVKTPAGTSTTSSTDHFTYQAPKASSPESPEAKLRDLLQGIRSSNIQHHIRSELSCLLTDALHSLASLNGYEHSKCGTALLSSRAAAAKADRRKGTQPGACGDLEQFVEVIGNDQHETKPKIPAKLDTSWSQAARGIEASLGCTRPGRQPSRHPSRPAHGQHRGHRSGGR